MNTGSIPTPRLRTTTRDLLLAFVLAKLAAIVPGALLTHRFQAHALASEMAPHVVAAVMFTLLVMLGGRQSLPDILEATAIRQQRPAGHLFGWFALALLAGVLIRLGTGGIVLGLFEVFDPEAAAAEFADLLAGYLEPASGVTLLLVALRLVGAAEEEFTYRRILQSCFCVRFGPAAGVLLVALLFGAMHLRPLAAVSGLCFALLYLASGRLWVAIIAHACSNLTYPVMFTLDLPLAREPFFITCYVATAVLVVACWVAFRSIRWSGIYR